MYDFEDIKGERNPFVDKYPYKQIKKLNNIAYQEWKRGSERCVICGEYTQTTREHLPPQSIYKATPKDVITVRACAKCQNSPDLKFAEFLAFYAIQNGETKSSVALLKHREVRYKNRNSDDITFIEHITRLSFTKIPIAYPDGTKKEEYRALWPSEFHDPIIIKLLHGFYWFLSGGKVLSDEEGKIVIVEDYNPSMKDEFLVKNAFPSINIGEGQFICTHIQGFEEPYEYIPSICFHFHSDNDIKKGYHVMVFLLLNKIESILGKLSVREIIDNVPARAIYDVQNAVYNFYPK